MSLLNEGSHGSLARNYASMLECIRGFSFRGPSQALASAISHIAGILNFDYWSFVRGLRL